jgi:hypothetical protein
MTLEKFKARRGIKRPSHWSSFDCSYKLKGIPREFKRHVSSGQTKSWYLALGGTKDFGKICDYSVIHQRLRLVLLW